MLDGLVAGKNSRVRFRADISNPGARPNWNWTVEYLDTIPPVRLDTTIVPDPVTPGTSMVDFATADRGHYSISADPGLPCLGGHLDFMVKPPGATSFVVRVTPQPVQALDFPRQDIPLSLDTVPAQPVSLPLVAGTVRSSIRRPPI